MTVTTQTNRIDHVGTGSATLFPYNFLVYEESHLEVYLDGALTTTGFTINNDIPNSNGDITFDVAPAAGVAITIIRRVPLTQLLDYTAFGPFPAETHEKGLDLGVMRDQQNLEGDSRVMRVPIEDGPIADLPNIATRATKLLGFDANGDPIVSDSTVDDVDALVAAGLGQGSLMTSFSFVGDGVNTDFVLGGITINHAASILAYIDGISQNPEVDYNVVVAGGSTTVTFTTAPPNLSDVRLHIVGFSKPVGAADASNITYIPHNGAPGVQGTAADNKLDETVNVKDFGAVPNDQSASVRIANRASIQAAIDFIALRPNGGKVVVDKLFYLSGTTDDTFDGDFKYCLLISTSNLHLVGSGELSFEQDGTLTNEGVIVLAQEPTTTLGGSEGVVTYIDNVKVNGLQFEMTGDPNSTKYSSVGTPGGKAVVGRFVTGMEIAFCSLKGRFMEGIMYKSFAVESTIHHNRAEFCFAGAFNTNGAGCIGNQITNNTARRCHTVVEDGGIGTLVQANVGRFCNRGIRQSGSTTERQGLQALGNTLEYMSQEAILARGDITSNIDISHNIIRFAGYGGISVFPQGTLGTWGDVYNGITIVANRTNDINLSGLSSDNGQVISVYGDDVVAMGNRQIDNVGGVHLLAVDAGTALDEIFPLDTITSSSGGTAEVATLADWMGTAPSETINLYIRDISGVFADGDTLTITGKGGISGTANGASTGANRATDGLRLLESGTDVSDNPYLTGNYFNDVTNQLEVANSARDGDWHGGKEIREVSAIYGQASTLDVHTNFNFITGGALPGSNGFNQGGRKYSVTTTPLIITAPLGNRGGYLMVYGDSATNRFCDLILATNASGVVQVVHTGNVHNAPVARTYAMDSGQRLTLAMASGTYTVITQEFFPASI